MLQSMSEDAVEFSCGPEPIYVNESSELCEGEQHLLKLLEEKNQLLEKDQRALTRIKSSAEMTEGMDRRSTGSISDNMDQFSQESPSLTRKAATDEELWELWGVTLRDWEENCRKKAKLIRQLVQQGIPEHMRGMAWICLSGTHNSELRDRYPKLINEVSPFEKQIVRDLARTFPEHGFFKERNGLGQESLLNVLKAYSVYDREVGYCQGSPFIVGMLLMQQIPEEEVFCIFIRLMEHYRLREVYKPSMADLGLYFYQLEKLIEELLPQLHIHFQAVGCQTSIYASPWFLTLFASSLSLNVAFRIMDIFLLDGNEILFRVAIALLEHHSNTLMKLDLEDMIKFFQKSLKPAHEADPDTLIGAALKVKCNTKKMKRWEKDYIIKRDKAIQENDELQKLRTDNSHLNSRVGELEKECASLADRLIQGQVTRAQEAEERFTIKRELATLKKQISVKQRDSQSGSDEESKTEGAPDALSALTENGKEEHDDVTDGVDKEQAVLDKAELPEERNDDINRSKTIPAIRLQSVERELMAAKEELDDAAEQLEQKRKELRESLLREALVQHELQATQLCVQELQKELLTVKKELSDLKAARTSAEDGDHPDSPSLPPDSATTALDNFDEANTMPSATSCGKDSHKNIVDKNPVADWV